MSLRSLIVKIGADTQAIDKALATVGSSSKTLADGLKKLGDTPLGKQAQVDAERLHKSIEALRAGQERLASTAKLAASGLDAIGGPARLTKQQLDEMNKVVLQGLDAFRALGRQAPAELTKVSQAIQRQQATLGGTQGGLFRRIFGDVGKEIATVAAGFVTGTALISGVKGAFDSLVGAAQGAIHFASQLDDLSKSTNVSIESLQELGFAGKRVGLDLNQIGDLVGILSKRIGSDDAGSTSAIQSLGLNIKELKALAPDRLFTVLAEAVSRISDPLAQAGIGAELFGKQFKAALKLANDGLDGTRQEARNLGAVLSEESVKKLDAFGDKVGDITTVLKVLAAEALTPVITGLTEFLALSARAAQATFINPEAEKEFARERNAFEKFNKEFQGFLANRAKQQQSQAGGAVPFSQANPLGGQGLTIVGDQAKALAAGGLVITQADLIANRLKALRTAALEPLTHAQQDQIVSLQKWGESETSIAGLVGASQQAVHRYLDAIKVSMALSAAEQKKFTAAMLELDSATGGFGATLSSIDGTIVEAIKFYLDAGVAQNVLADAYGLTSVQIKAIASSRELDTKLIALNTAAAIANLSTLTSLGRVESDEIAALKESQTAREALNSAMTIPPEALAGLRLVATFDIATILLLEKQVKLRESLRKLAQSPAEVGSFNTGATGLENLGFPNQILSPAQLQQLAEAERHFKEMNNLLSGLSGAFAELAQISGSSFGEIAQDIARVISALNIATKAAQQFKEAETKTGKATALAGGIGAIAGATGSGSTASRVVGGAATGAQVGSLFGPYGTAVGAGVGALVGFIRGIHKGAAEKAALDVGRDLGVKISEGLSKQLAEAGRIVGRQAATLLHLDQIIAESGGVDAFGFQKATQGARDLFSMLETGVLTAEQVGGAFDRVFSQLIPSAISKTSRLATAQFVELQQLAIRNNVRSPAVEEFRRGQIDSVQGGLETLVTKGTVGSQSAATGIGGAIGASFAELQRQGVPLLEILKQFQPTIEAFRKQLQKTGFDGGAAFGTILALSELAADKIAGPALESVSALQQVLAGLANTGGLDQETFTGLADQIGATFESLVAQGKDANQILKLMAPSLQTIFELQERTGFAVDETTANLIAQAKAQGLVGDQFKSAEERQVAGLDRIAIVLEEIAKAFGVTLPGAAKAAAEGVNRELKKITAPDIDFTIKGNVVIDFPTTGTPERQLFGPRGFASRGGLVTPSGIQHFAEGGRVQPFDVHHVAQGGRVIPFAVRGTDTVPAMLTPGEVVLTQPQQRVIAASLVEQPRIPAPLWSILQQFRPVQTTQAQQQTSIAHHTAGDTIQYFAEGGRVVSIQGVVAAPSLMLPVDRPRVVSPAILQWAPSLQTRESSNTSERTLVERVVERFIHDRLLLARTDQGVLAGQSLKVNALQQAFSHVAQTGSRDQAFSWIQDQVNQTVHNVQHFAAGGVVAPFQRRGTDTVPAMLTPGEVVLTQPQQRVIAASLMNQPQLPAPLVEILKLFQSTVSTARVQNTTLNGGDTLQHFAEGGRVLAFPSVSVVPVGLTQSRLERVRDIFSHLITSVVKTVMMPGHDIESVAPTSSRVDTVLSAITHPSQIVQALARQMVDHGTVIGGATNTIVNDILHSFAPTRQVFDSSRVVYASTGGTINTSGIQYFPQGGRVLPFLSRGTDTVPAMLTPGEVVLNESQQQAITQALTSGGTHIENHFHGPVLAEREYIKRMVTPVMLESIREGVGRQQFDTLTRRRAG